jgi:enamine deaminase RidA (YjgF/YER057c/UK114 family)
MNSNFQRTVSDGLHMVVVSQGTVTNIFATLWPVGNEDIAAVAGRVIRLKTETGADIVKCDVFGPCELFGAFLQKLESSFQPHGMPVTWVEGASCNGSPVAGITVRLIAGKGIAAETVMLAGRPVGKIYQDPYARYCVLGGINSNAPSVLPGMQAQMTMEALEAALNAAGMDMTCLTRTWFYNNCLLEWYDIFNSVRTKFYRERGVFNRLIPASTGISGKNPYGTALVAGAEAMVLKHPGASVMVVTSPLQNQALSYGSAFSRAVEIITPLERRLVVSGTASIDETGKTVFTGDVAAQISRTIKVVDELLRSRQMAWTDVVRAIAYVKHQADAEVFVRYCRTSGMPLLPWVIAHNDICREDLLFEIEVDAVKSV